MQKVQYSRPSTVEEAVAVLAQGGPTARVLAGGTDIIVQARERRRPVELFVDIKKIEEVMQLTYDPATGLTVGAATPCYRIYNDDTVKRVYPALVDATSVIGGTAIQGRASIGGNLCNSGPAGDSIPAQIVLEGTVNIAGPGGRRQVAVEDFCTGPGRNVLADGEFVVSIHFPTPAANSGAAWDRFIPRNEMDIAVVNAGVNLRLDGDTVTWAKIAIGAVGPKVLLVPTDALVGKPLSDETIAAQGQAAKDTATPIDDMRGSIKQRKHLSDVYVQRMVRKAAARALGG